MKWLCCFVYCLFLIVVECWEPKYIGPVKVAECEESCIWITGDKSRSITCGYKMENLLTVSTSWECRKMVYVYRRKK